MSSSHGYPGNIFMFNPLTAFFLSGLATELFILICDSNPLNKTHREETVTLDTSKRIDRWQEWFTNLCIPLFDKHKEEYEQSQFTDGRYNMNPFEVHSSMLISASEMILHYTTHNQLSSKTIDNVSKWFELISSLRGTRLGNHFGATKLRDLISLSRDYTRQSSTSQSPSVLDHPHFSPGALFIRAMFVVHIHKKRFSRNQMILWEDCNAVFLAKYLCLKDYFEDAKDDTTLRVNFVPTFPYIHHLPRKKLYNVWNVTDQLSRPVPIHDIFYHVTVCIHGKAITFNTYNTTTNSLSYCESGCQAKDRDQLIAFESILTMAQDSLDKEFNMIVNCEKQRRFQKKRKKNLNPTETFCGGRPRKRLNSPNIPIRLFRFLFPPHQYFESFDDDSESEVFAL